MQDILSIHFAPLQGYTEAFYRNAHAACFGGIDSYYTPFVRLEKTVSGIKMSVRSLRKVIRCLI